MKRLVVDASVVLKWYLPDERYGEKALSLLHRYLMDDVDLLAPSLLEYEVVNGLTIAGRRGRIGKDRILSAVEGFVNLGITLSDLSALYGPLVHYCDLYRCSAYDASYLALADKDRANLITADERLYQVVKRDLDWVQWLGEPDDSVNP